MSKNNINYTKTPIWHYPWRYQEGFLIAFALLIIGMALEYFTDGGGIEPLEWPANVITGIVFINILVIINAFLNKNKFIKWLSSVPAAICSISLFVFLTLLMGFTIQDDQSVNTFIRKTGLSHITHSYMFVFSQVFFLLSLGLVTLRRLTPINRKNIGFFLNHGGLWIAITAAILGSGDLKRLSMELTERNDFTNIAYNQKNKPFRLRVALRLIDFDVNYYSPKLAIANHRTGEFASPQQKSIIQSDSNYSVDLQDYKIIVKEYIPFAKKQENRYIKMQKAGATPAAYVDVTDKKTNTTTSGWISCGSIIYPIKLLTINRKHSLVMLKPEPKKFSSVVEYLTKEGQRDTVKIEVNKPVKINGWKIYQSGYDSAMGKWSTLSILELVNDPWLNVVYTGIFMLFGGAVYLFWVGRTKK